jgi:hypothetical protein
MVYRKDQQQNHCFFIFINYLPNVTVNTNLSDNPKTILLTYDTSVIVHNPNFTDFEKVIYMFFKNMNEWFSTNFLSLKFGKIHFMQFVTKHGSRNVIIAIK